MKAYLWVGVALRAASIFVLAAWRRAWWVLIPASLGWASAMSPDRGPVWTGAALVVTLVGSTALYRLAMADTRTTLSAGVGRLAIVWLLTVVFLAVLASLLFVVFLAAAYAVASAGVGFDAKEVRTWASAVDDRGRLVLAVVAIGGLGLLAWTMTRVALAAAATLATGRVQVLNTWPLTRRIGWRLLLARAMIGAPAIALAVLALGAPRVYGATGASGAWMLSALAGLVIGGAWLPLNTGLMTYIYQDRARH